MDEPTVRPTSYLHRESADWARVEIERLRAALDTIARWYIDCADDAEEMAKYAAAALASEQHVRGEPSMPHSSLPAGESSPVVRPDYMDGSPGKSPLDLSQGGISDRLTNFDEWGNRIRERD